MSSSTDTDWNICDASDDSAWDKLRAGLDRDLLESIQDKLDTTMWMRLHTLIMRPLRSHIQDIE